MASNKGNNLTLSGNRGIRLNNLDRVPTLKSPSRLGNGIAANSRAWDSNANIWANGGNSSTFVDGPADPEPCNGTALHSNEDTQFLRGKVGSRSLLSSSESEDWNHQSTFPWNVASNGNSSTPSRQQGQVPSVHLRNEGHSTGTVELPLNNHGISPLPSAGQRGRFSAPNYGLQEPTGHSYSTAQQQNTMSSNFGTVYNHSHEDGKQWKIDNPTFRANDSSSSTHSNLPFLSTKDEFSSLKPGKLPHNTLSIQPRSNFDLPNTQFRSSQASNPLNICYHSTPYPSNRLSGSTDRSLSDRQELALQFDGHQDQLLTKFHEIDLQAERMAQAINPRFQIQDPIEKATSARDWSLEGAFSRSRNPSGSEYPARAGQTPTSSDGAAHISSQFASNYRQSVSYVDRESASSATSQYRRGLSSPFYSANDETPPSGLESVRSPSGQSLFNQTSNDQMGMPNRESRGSRLFLLEEQYMLPNVSYARLQYNQSFGFDGYPGSLRLNPLAVPYAIPAYGRPTSSYQPRYPSREHDSSQIIRSSLLEEFRANHKTSKRYELKDIYNHVVEFSGDQHGSRFIQQKLETANSDEKDQIFAEIQPNCLQLMTDVFGNYVIQKLFEHGNQAQKKTLANQMKNRVMDLSTQMYGCRVVQKALEHILTDQQASMVKELEAHVLKCVKDQNGNHVIQKAIERVPAEHIQFIINAFTGQVSRLAAHPYGCRVIQRMLEHCEEPARQSILRELHAGVYPLITDQYGNYVIQHVIEKGRDYDRAKVVATVISQLLIFSKHKFASNVVEKSIQCAEATQRAEILRILTTPNDKGESPLLGLMRDQYGNYVIQKSLGDFGFKDEEREHLVEQCKPELMKLKRFSSGKQVMALEKLIFDGDFEPNLSSSQSSTIPSTDTSTVEGPTTLTLPPVQIWKTSLIVEPATAIASTP